MLKRFLPLVAFCHQLRRYWIGDSEASLRLRAQAERDFQYRGRIRTPITEEEKETMDKTLTTNTPIRPLLRPVSAFRCYDWLRLFEALGFLLRLRFEGHVRLRYHYYDATSHKAIA